MKQFLNVPLSLVFACCIWLAPVAHGQSNENNDCSENAVEYRGGEGLTQQEITERMDSALFESLNKYENCLQQSSASQNSNGSSGSDGSGSGSGAAGASAASTASTGIEGTEQAEAKAETDATASNPIDPRESDQQSTARQQQTLNNGKAPEDIPATDNDSILQQRVREAAENEPNPEKRAKLWNEYRKLKGLPQI